MINRIIEYSVRNRALVLIAAAIVMGLGVYAMLHTPVDAIPDLSENQIIVWADWMGRSPRDVEDQVTYPLTVNLQGLAGVKDVRGLSEYGFSMINVIFDDSIDFYFARDRVRERLGGLQALVPPGVTVQLAPDATALGQIFWYTVEGDGYSLDELRAIQDFTVRYQLQAVFGIAEVATVGGFVREYQIDIDSERLRAYGLTPMHVWEAVRKSNVSVGGGVIQGGGQEYLVRGAGWVKSVADLEGIVVMEVGGVPVTVGRVASVHLGPAPRRNVLEKDGREVVGGVCLMRYGQNPLEVTQRLHERIASLTLPPGVRITPFYERTGLIQHAIGTLKGTIIEEIVIASLVVLMVLMHLRSAFVICVTLPMAALVSFILMYLFKVPSNIMSLSGIAISIGVLIDAGIVMTENAYHRLHDRFKGAPVTGDTREIVIEACKVVGGPLFFSVVIMLISFLPIFALGGMEGKMFHPMAFTKSFALVGVAILAVTVVPALIPWFIRGKLRGEGDSWIVRSFVGIYKPMLEFFLTYPAAIVLLTGTILMVALPFFPRHPPYTWLVAVIPFCVALGALICLRSNLALVACGAFLAAVAAGAYLWFEPLGEEYMPPLREGTILDMPMTRPNISIVQAGGDLKRRDAILKEFPEVHQVVGKVGRAETATDPAAVDMIETIVTLRPPEWWPRRKLPDEIDEAKRREIQAELRELALKRLRDDAPRVQKEVLEALGPVSEKVLAEFGPRFYEHIGAEGVAAAAKAMGVAPVDREALEARRESIVAAFVKKLNWELTDVAEARLGRPVTLTRMQESDIVGEMDDVLKVPGWANAFTKPIMNRVDMLSTGVRQPIGVKVFGDDLEQIQKVATEIQEVLKTIKGNWLPIADQITGENYLEITVDRGRAARFGVNVEDVQMVVETALGGQALSQTVEGRRRFPIRVRFPRESRLDAESVGRVLVGKVPLSQVADVKVVPGPSMIKTENGQLRAYVQCSVRGRDLIGFVLEAKKAVAEKVTLPPGMRIEWAGQFQAQERMQDTLKIVIPSVFALILVILYMTYRDIADSAMMFLAVPGAIAGGAIFQAIWGHNFSAAVWIGYIACMGLATETGIVMLVYLREAIDNRGGMEAMTSEADIRTAVIQGAVNRLRPKLLTEATTVLGLIPMLWATGVGSEYMQPMAAPVLGGVLIADEVIDIFIPVLFYKVRCARLKKRTGGAETPPVEMSVSRN